jgi:hypothetical protein
MKHQLNPRVIKKLNLEQTEREDYIYKNEVKQKDENY